MNVLRIVCFAPYFRINIGLKKIQHYVWFWTVKGRSSSAFFFVGKTSAAANHLKSPQITVSDHLIKCSIAIRSSRDFHRFRGGTSSFAYPNCSTKVAQMVDFLDLVRFSLDFEFRSVLFFDRPFVCIGLSPAPLETSIKRDVRAIFSRSKSFSWSDRHLVRLCSRFAAIGVRLHLTLDQVHETRYDADAPFLIRNSNATRSPVRFDGEKCNQKRTLNRLFVTRTAGVQPLN